MNNENLESIIVRNAQTINQLRDAIDQTVKNRDENPQAWKKACEAFNTQYDSLAFPGELNVDLISSSNMIQKLLLLLSHI